MFRSSSILCAAFAAVTATLLATEVCAQGLDESTARIRARLAAGDRVTVVKSDGRSASGVLVDVSAGVLRLRDTSGTSELALQEAAEVQKRGDSPWNGLLIGATLGAALGFGTYTDCEPVAPYRTCEGNLATSRGMETAVAAALFGAIGLTVDLLRDGSTTVYRAPASRRGFTVTATPRRVQAGYRITF